MQAVHVHIRGQLALERHAPSRHMQLVPAPCELAYESARPEAVSVREVVCKARRRGNKE
jgi:hypothetical protein